MQGRRGPELDAWRLGIVSRERLPLLYAVLLALSIAVVPAPTTGTFSRPSVFFSPRTGYGC